MMITIRPLSGWPREGGLTPAHERQQALFQSNQRKTLELLEYEVSKLGGEAIVVELAVERTDIRVDGWLKKGAVPRHPGVVVTFDTRYGRRSVPRDKFLNWRHNVHAVARTLERLRDIDRWDSKQTGEQYEGFRPALEAGPIPGGPMGDVDAVRFIFEAAGMPIGDLTDPSDLQVAYRRAAKNLHPDQGGDLVAFQTLQRARDILSAEPAASNADVHHPARGMRSRR